MPRYGDLVDLLGFMPGWLSTLIVVVAATWTICMAGIAIGKTGRNPLWALVGFVFFPLLTVGLWWLALAHWPRQDAASKPEA